MKLDADESEAFYNKHDPYHV